MPKQDFMKFLKSLLPSPPAGDLGGINPSTNLMEPSGPSQWWQGWHERSAPDARHISENLRSMREDRAREAADRLSLLDFRGGENLERIPTPLIPGLLRDMRPEKDMGYLERAFRADPPGGSAPLEMREAIMGASPVARARDTELFSSDDFDFFQNPKADQYRVGLSYTPDRSVISDPGNKKGPKRSSPDGEKLMSSQEYLGSLYPGKRPGPSLGSDRASDSFLARGFGDLDEGPSILFGDGPTSPKGPEALPPIEAEFSLVPDPKNVFASKESLSLVPLKNAAAVKSADGAVAESPKPPKPPKPPKSPKSPKSDDSDFGFGDTDFGLGGKAGKGKGKGIGKGKWLGAGVLAGLVGAGLHAGNQEMKGEESPDFFSGSPNWQNVKPPTSIAGGKYKVFPFDVDMEKVGPVSNEEALARYLRESAQTLSADTFRGQGRGDVDGKEREYQAWLNQAMKLVQDLAAKNNVEYNPQEIYEMAFTRWQDKNKSRKKK